MLIIKPPEQVAGATNLSKGAEVFNVVANLSEDTIVGATASAARMYDLLLRVHSLKYVDSILSGREINGYGSTSDAENAHSVKSCAVMHYATNLAFNVKGEQPVFAPVSGFHHAGYNYCGGYCTFNGLMTAAYMIITHKGPNTRVLIIDGDGHYGDGTADIIDKLSMGKNVEHCSLAKSEVGGDAAVAQHRMIEALKAEQWDLVLYQAGADSHIEDPYFSGYLDDAQWENRDAAVFSICRDRRLPLVFNLAGGYNGKKTILLHHSTVSTARRVYFVQQRAHLSPLPGSL